MEEKSTKDPKYHDYSTLLVVGGKGEQGKPYPLAEDECDDSVYKENGFNIYVSNNIALDRSLPDIRHP
ncbi:polypeptide N-acetylgalactosaminyltransferase-like 6, partial [Tachysurus ichikawai]